MTYFPISPSLAKSILKPAYVLFSVTLLMLIFSGCASSHMTAITKVKPAEPYVNLMVVYVKDAPEIAVLNENTYNEVIRNKFNTLDDIKVRTHLEKTISNNVGTSATLVNRASGIFGVGEDIDYDSFLNKIKSTGAEAIIIVNSNARWVNTSYTTYNVSRRNNVNFTDAEQSPNAAFLCYLVDINTGKPVWMAQSNVYGTTLDSFNTISNSLARDVGYKLKKEGFIYKLVSDLPLPFNEKKAER